MSTIKPLAYIFQSKVSICVGPYAPNGIQNVQKP